MLDFECSGLEMLDFGTADLDWTDHLVAADFGIPDSEKLDFGSLDSEEMDYFAAAVDLERQNLGKKDFLHTAAWTMSVQSKLEYKRNSEYQFTAIKIV